MVTKAPATSNRTGMALPFSKSFKMKTILTILALTFLTLSGYKLVQSQKQTVPIPALALARTESNERRLSDRMDPEHLVMRGRRIRERDTTWFDCLPTVEEQRPFEMSDTEKALRMYYISRRQDQWLA